MQTTMEAFIRHLNHKYNEEHKLRNLLHYQAK